MFWESTGGHVSQHGEECGSFCTPACLLLRERSASMFSFLGVISKKLTCFHFLCSGHHLRLLVEDFVLTPTNYSYSLHLASDWDTSPRHSFFLALGRILLLNLSGNRHNPESDNWTVSQNEWKLWKVNGGKGGPGSWLSKVEKEKMDIEVQMQDSIDRNCVTVTCRECTPSARRLPLWDFQFTDTFSNICVLYLTMICSSAGSKFRTCRFLLSAIDYRKSSKQKILPSIWPLPFPCCFFFQS